MSLTKKMSEMKQQFHAANNVCLPVVSNKADIEVVTDIEGTKGVFVGWVNFWGVTKNEYYTYCSQYAKLNGIIHNGKWPNSFIAAMALHPMQSKDAIVDILLNAVNDDTFVFLEKKDVDQKFDVFCKQFETLIDMDVAKMSRKGRWYFYNSLGQIAWKQGNDFRTGKSYLFLWLNGVMIYKGLEDLYLEGVWAQI